MRRSTSASSTSYSMGAPSSSMDADRTSLTESRTSSSSSRRDLAARRSGKVAAVDSLTGAVVTGVPVVQAAVAAKEAKVGEAARVASPRDLARWPEARNKVAGADELIKTLIIKCYN